MFELDNDPQFQTFESREYIEYPAEQLGYTYSVNNGPQAEFMNFTGREIKIKAGLVCALLEKIGDKQPVTIMFDYSKYDDVLKGQIIHKYVLRYKLVNKINIIQHSSKLSALEISRWPNNFFWKTVWHEIKYRIGKYIKNAHHRAKTGNH